MTAGGTAAIDAVPERLSRARAPRPASVRTALDGGVVTASRRASSANADRPSRSFRGGGCRALARDEADERTARARRPRSPARGPYRPGDDMRTIDWAASARLSSARAAPTSSSSATASPKRRPGSSSSRPQPRDGSSTRCPSVALKGRGDAARARRGSVDAAQAGGFAGYLDFADGEPFWRRRAATSHRGRAGRAARRRTSFRAPTVPGLSCEHLVEHRRASDRELRLRPLRLPRPAAGRRVDAPAPASLGCRARRDSGPGLGAELPADRRRRRPVLGSADAPGHARPADGRRGRRAPHAERGAVHGPARGAPRVRPRAGRAPSSEPMTCSPSSSTGPRCGGRDAGR